MDRIYRMPARLTNRVIVALLSGSLFFVACRADVETSTDQLVSAVRSGDVNKATSAVADGANVNAEVTGVPILIIASAEKCNPKILSLLLTNGAHINAKDRNTGSTALMISITVNRIDCVERLLASDAKLDDQDNMGTSPLYAAVAGGNVAIVDLLLKHGAVNFVNLGDNRGVTPLMVAAVSGSMPTVKLLVESGADLKMKDRDGQTAKMHALRKGHADIVQFLHAR